MGKLALIKPGLTHAEQFEGADRALKTLRIYLHHIFRDIARKMQGRTDLLAKYSWVHAGAGVTGA